MNWELIRLSEGTIKCYDLDEVRINAKSEVFADLKKMGYGFDNFTGYGKSVVTEDEWKEFETKHLKI